MNYYEVINFNPFRDQQNIINNYCNNDATATYAVFNAVRTVQTVIPKIKDVIYNDPATIVFWEDGTKTVVKCKNEKFDPEKGLAMAFSKKMLGNKGNYYNIFKKWLPDEKPNTTVPIVKKWLPDEKPGISVPIFYERRPKK